MSRLLYLIVLVVLVVVASRFFFVRNEATLQRANAGNERVLLAERQSAATAGGLSAVSGHNPGPRFPKAKMEKDWEDPAWRGARFNEAIIDIEKRYGRFFSKVPNWSADQREKLKQKLAANHLALIRAGIPEHFPETQDEAKRHEQQVKKTFDDGAQSIREMLGNDDYAKLDDYEKSETYRENVSSITNAMRSKGVVVSEELEESLLSAYAASMQEAAIELGKTDIDSLNAAQLQELRARQTRSFQSKLAKRASGLLNENQLNVLLETEMEQGGGT